MGSEWREPAEGTFGVYAAGMTFNFPVSPQLASGWKARLELGFEARGARTELVRRRHAGPLLVQKALHPEGDAPCHAIVLHPPSGLVGGDQLSLETTVGERAAALLTTPGAAKWYRSAGPLAVSHTQLRVERGATLEYLPREAIVFDGARVEAELSIDLAADARLAAWDVWCLGRLHAGERFTSGAVTTRLQVTVDGREVLYERAQVAGAGSLRRSAAGLGGAPVFGTLLMVGAEPSPADLAQCRALPVREGDGALTRLPDVLCARYRGQSTEAAHAWFESLWTVLRPVMLGRAAVPPRIWAV